MSWLPRPYPDETFYSVLVRLHRYLGRPTYSAFSRMLTGSRHYVALCHLPCGLGLLGSRLGLDQDAVERLIDQTSTLNYHTAFASDAVRERAKAQMCATGSSLQFILGLANFPIRLPDRLRICRSCLEEMNSEFGEVWWRRAHQLPGLAVCERHQTWLENSIALVPSNRHLLAPPKVQPVTSATSRTSNPSAAQVLFARLSNNLLQHPGHPRTLQSWRRHYREQLADLGYLRGTCHVNVGAALHQIERFWAGGIQIDGTSVLISKSALSDFFRNSRTLAPPAQHILIGQALSAAPVQERPFGAPPYRCENPLADHYGKRVVMGLRLLRDKGKLHGHFYCECGYSYSRTRKLDGTIGLARLREFGPSARRFLLSNGAAKMSLRAKARAMGVDPMTVRAIERQLDQRNLQGPNPNDRLS